MSILASIFSLTMVAQTLRMSVPYACAAVGGVWSERSGVVNIALEGMLLAGGLGAVVVQHATGSALLGVLAGAAVGASFGAAHALAFVWGRVDAIVSGMALNLIAAGGTRFLLRALYDSSSNSPAIAGIRLPFSTSGSAGMLFATVVDPIFLLTLALTATTSVALARSRFGLRVRACGEAPSAAASVGIAVGRTRVAAVALGGAVCGLGGVALAFDQHQFQSGMSGGRGFIALAAVIVSGWRAGPAALACVVFAALDAAQIVLQDQSRVPQGVVQMLPYVTTLVALLLFARSKRGKAPAGIGKHPA